MFADLDNDVFATREKAGEELAKFGRTIEPALRELRAKPPFAEVRRRAEKLLSAMSSDGLAGDDLRTMRAVEVLEGLGTPEATAILETLAKETTHTLVTEEARAALSRLRKKR